MPSRRPAILRPARERVLSEFCHRCPICGGEKPQVHHIDENPTNNDLLNLLPLCPNCHLTDQHNPTAPMVPAKLALFRKFKDPTILSPQFVSFASSRTPQSCLRSSSLSQVQGPHNPVSAVRTLVREVSLSKSEEHTSELQS